MNYIFQNTTAFVDKLKSIYADRGAYAVNREGEYYADSMTTAVTGSQRYVQKAVDLVDRIEASVERDQQVWQRDVVGAYPSVPDFLANDPECMWRREPTENDNSPIKIWVDLVTSGGIDSHIIERRGACISALILNLTARNRAVELWSMTNMHGRDGITNICIKLPSNPIDISVISYITSSAGFQRNLLFGFGYKHSGFDGGWGNALAKGTWEARSASCRKVLLKGLASDVDIVIPAIHYVDRHKFATDDQCIAWVNAMVASVA